MRCLHLLLTISLGLTSFPAYLLHNSLPIEDCNGKPYVRRLMETISNAQIIILVDNITTPCVSCMMAGVNQIPYSVFSTTNDVFKSNYVLWSDTGESRTYIVLISDLKVYRMFANSFYSLPIWKTTKNVIILLKCYNECEAQVEGVFQTSFKRRIWNIAVIVYKSDNPVPKIPDLWTYNHLLETFTKHASNLDILTVLSEFPEHVTDFKGYRIRVATFHHPPHVIKYIIRQRTQWLGIEGKLLQLLVVASNFSATIKELHGAGKWGFMSNGTWMGLVGDVARGKLDIGFANIFLTYDRYQIVDFTTPHTDDRICWAVPKAEQLAAWRAIVMPFHNGLWVAVTCSIILVMVAIQLMSQLINERHLESYGNVLFYIISISLSVSSPHNPTRSILRWTVGGWLWWTIVLSTAYQAGLYGFMTFPKSYPELETLDSILSSGLKLGCEQDVKDMFSEQSNPSDKQLFHRLVVDDDTSSLKRVSDRQMAILIGEKMIRYTVYLNFTNNFGRPTIYVTSNCLASFQVGFMVPKRSFLIPRFNTLIHRAREAGLISHWYDAIIYDAVLKKKDVEHEDDDAKITKLTLSHEQGAIYILIIGHLISSLVFLLEMLQIPAKVMYIYQLMFRKLPSTHHYG